MHARALAAAAALAATLALPAAAHAAPDARGPARVPGETGRVVVGFASGGASAALASASARGASPERRADSAGFAVLRPPRGVSASTFALRLASDPGITFAEPERVVRASFTPNDPRFSQQWNMTGIGAPSAWDRERGASSVTVAVVDSGVDLEHPDLAGRLDTSRDYDYVAGDTVADDEFGHGTHVAGIVAAATNNGRDVAGLAHGCTILPVRVLDAYGTGEDTDVALGIRLAASRGADVINLSLGLGESSRVVADAIEYALARDVVIVAAAGNGGDDVIDYPAAYPGVIAVGATDVAKARAEVSSYGEALDLVAPGQNVLSLWPVTGRAAVGVPVMRLTGTSIAAPHVAGTAALLRSENPTWTAARVAHRLAETAEDLGPAGDDLWFGEGLVRADLALAPAAPPSDDDLPGVPLPASPAAGDVDAASDPADVYAVELAHGHRLELTFRGSPGTTMAVELIDPWSDSLEAAVPVVSTESTGGAVSFTYAVPYGDAGVHRIVVRARAGAGAYSLTWRRGFATSVSASAPATVAWNAWTSVTGRVVSAAGGGVGGVSVVLDMRTPSATRWLTGIVTRRTDAEGRYRINVHPSRGMVYRVRFEGVPGELGSTSRSVTVWPKAALTPPRPTSVPRRLTPFTLAGTLTPRHAAGGQDVKISVQLRDEATESWITYAVVHAVNRDSAQGTRYLRRLSLPKGRWRFIASVPGCYWHAATSTVSYLTVP